jgi:hypothetical protein
MFNRLFLFVALGLTLGCSAKSTTDSGGDSAFATSDADADTDTDTDTDADSDTDTDTDTDSDCNICDTCDLAGDGSECGTGGACISFDGAIGFCSMECSTDGSCPGSATCWELTGEDGSTYEMCLNSDADTAGPCTGVAPCQ